MKTEHKQKIAFALLMGIVTTGIISFTLLAINVGFTSHFLATWFKSWAIAYAVVIPAILFIAPQIQALVNKLIPSQTDAETVSR